MKNVYLSVFAAAALLFTACGSDESIDSNDTQTGTLTTALSFEGVADKPKAAASNCIPVTSWSNVKQVQVFVYDNTGKVIYTKVVQPTAGSHSYTWTDVPAGTGYTVGVMANVKSDTDPIDTKIGATSVVWNANVKNLIVNSALSIDMKQKAAFQGPYATYAGNASLPHKANKAYNSPSEIFTAYATSVNITQSGTTTLGPLNLKREVAMMRVRIDQSQNGNDVVALKSNANASILIQRQTTGFEFPLGTNKGGIKTATASVNRIVEVAGVNTFKFADPTSPAYAVPGGGTPKIIDGNFKLWQDVIVFPNVTKAQQPGITPSTATVAADRQYFVLISGTAPVGYVPEGTTTALTVATPVYWYANVKGAFVENSIREVNLVLKSKGSVTPPDVPTEEGTLVVTLGDPEPWNSVIQSENIEM